MFLAREYGLAPASEFHTYCTLLTVLMEAVWPLRNPHVMAGMRMLVAHTLIGLKKQRYSSSESALETLLKQIDSKVKACSVTILSL